MLTARAVGARTASWTVVAKRGVARASVPLIPVAAFGPLALIAVAESVVTSASAPLLAGASVPRLASAAIWLPVSGLDRLVRRSVLGLAPSSVLLTEVGLTPSALLTKIALILVSKLLLVAVLIKPRRAAVVEVVGSVIGVIQLPAVDVIGVEVIPI